eukprot:scaffold134989_cov33-Tisochrysis_lutea.AAC.2
MAGAEIPSPLEFWPCLVVVWGTPGALGHPKQGKGRCNERPLGRGGGKPWGKSARLWHLVKRQQRRQIFSVVFPKTAR